MPTPEVKKRGGSMRTRTVKLPGGKHLRCDVVRKKGPKGGQTVCGRVHKTKKSSKKPARKRKKR